MSLTIYIELEERMMAKNDTLDETNNLSHQNVFSVREFGVMPGNLFIFGPKWLCLVNLTIDIELEGRMIAQNDTHNQGKMPRPIFCEKFKYVGLRQFGL